MDLKSFYSKIESDTDYNEVLHRFCENEALLNKFLHKFPQDNSFSNLKLAVEDLDYKLIEDNAHTLKGVAANLNFIKLKSVCSELVNRIRSGEIENVPNLFEKVQTEYYKIVNEIDDLV